jgi:hypothetical protein
MIIVLATVILFLFAAFLEIVAAAPCGYEDEWGFHLGVETLPPEFAKHFGRVLINLDR